MADEKKRRKKLKKIFERADEDGNGSLDQLEVRHLIRRIFKTSKVDLASQNLIKYAETQFNLVDKDGSGTLDFEEFLELYDKLLTDPQIPEEMKLNAKQTETEKKKKIVIPEITEEQRASYRQTFDMFDTDKSGAIDAKELGAVMTKLGVKMKTSQLKKMIKAVDIDGNGEIDFEEFLQMMKTITIDPFQEVIGAFTMFDVDSDGHISRDDLRAFMEKIEGVRPSEEVLDEMMKVGDPRGNGNVTLRDFQRVIKD
eukprot:TRINITY_DN8826_c0_g1_i1.p1 TRINITY_DN8826_c0_g1~~TRINITY_DN8826_c0_g1_i1.p1  ORF type:complete len:262 (-),score=83.06 TRINITY_DN8826_c0_g1_i1:35-799(-)